MYLKDKAALCNTVRLSGQPSTNTDRRSQLKDSYLARAEKQQSTASTALIKVLYLVSPWPQLRQHERWRFGVPPFGVPVDAKMIR